MGLPLGSNPAPTVSSAKAVSTTGWPGVPRTWSVPPMRSVISSGRPEAVKPAFCAAELDHQACRGAALEAQAAVGVEVRHDDLAEHDVHDVGVVPDALGRQRAAADDHAVEVVVRQRVAADQRAVVVVVLARRRRPSRCCGPNRRRSAN